MAKIASPSKIHDVRQTFCSVSTVQKGDSLKKTKKKQGINKETQAQDISTRALRKRSLSSKILVPALKGVDTLTQMIEFASYFSNRATLLDALIYLIKNPKLNGLKQYIKDNGMDIVICAVLFEIHPYLGWAHVMYMLIRDYGPRFFSSEKE